MDFLKENAGAIVFTIAAIVFVYATVIEPRLGKTYNDEQEAPNDNEE